MAVMPQLLDAQGRPIRRQTLAEPQATGGLTGVRSVWQGAVAPGLTPAGLAQVLRACDEGNLDAYLTLAEEMEERDPHYFSVLGMRKRAVSGVAPSVTPASEDAEDVMIADEVRAQIAEHDGFPGLIEDVLDALGKGFSVTEILWRPAGNRWEIEGFELVDPRWFTYDRELGREVRLKDESDLLNGIPLEPGHFILHEARLKSGLPFRGGLARVAAFSWMCKAYTLKDWIAFVELYGLPLRLGRYGPDATKEDVQKLFSAVANIGTDAAAVLPESMKIDFEQTTSAGTGDKVFENLARYVDEQLSKAVLGQTMTADDGGSLAQAKVHDGVRHDIAKTDARAVSAVLKRQLVKVFVDVNFGVREAYPKLAIEIAEPEDVKLIVESVEKLSALGMRFKAAELYGKLGLTQPEKGDETIGGASAPAAPPPAANGDPPEDDDQDEARNRAHDAGCRCGGCRATALNRAAEPDEIDEIEAEALADWEEIMAPMLAPVEAIVASATSYEEILERLPQALPGMPASRLVDSLVKAMFKARALGDVQDG